MAWYDVFAKAAKAVRTYLNPEEALCPAYVGAQGQAYVGTQSQAHVGAQTNRQPRARVVAQTQPRQNAYAMAVATPVSQDVHGGQQTMSRTPAPANRYSRKPQPRIVDQYLTKSGEHKAYTLEDGSVGAEISTPEEKLLHKLRTTNILAADTASLEALVDGVKHALDKTRAVDASHPAKGRKDAIYLSRDKKKDLVTREALVNARIRYDKLKNHYELKSPGSFNCTFNEYVLRTINRGTIEYATVESPEGKTIYSDEHVAFVTKQGTFHKADLQAYFRRNTLNDKEREMFSEIIIRAALI